MALSKYEMELLESDILVFTETESTSTPPSARESITGVIESSQDLMDPRAKAKRAEDDVVSWRGRVDAHLEVFGSIVRKLNKRMDYLESKL